MRYLNNQISIKLELLCFILLKRHFRIQSFMIIKNITFFQETVKALNVKKLFKL